MSKQPFTISSKLADLPHLPLSSLTELQGELKDLTTKNYNKLKRSLLEFGIFVPFFVWQNNGHNYILDGHQRKRVLVKEGYTGNVPVVYVEADNPKEAKGKLLVISSQYGTISQEGYDTFTFDLDNEWLDSTVYFDALHFEFGENGQAADGRESQDAEPQIDRAKELQEQWGTELGQLWQIGEHRLICGDCTDRAVVEMVMRGEKAEMMFTDPPYGVAVGDKNKYLNSIAPSNRIEENLENDTLDEPALTKMLCEAFGNAVTVCLAGGAWYVTAPAGPLHMIFGQILKDMGIWRQTIVWVKNNATFAPLGVDYHWRAEPIFYGWLPGAGHRFYGGRQQDTVWEIDRPLKSPEHPTMKPVELVQRAVANSSKSGEIVLDPFAGSGTTGIACQNLGRQARMIEISPAYTAVILQRFSDAFPDIEIKLIQ